jgi:ribosomal protein S18 acetylase RimI-like enzyme
MTYRISRLTSQHQTADFSCGPKSLNAYIRHQALHQSYQGWGRVQVLTEEPNPRVIGYYTLSASRIERSHIVPVDIQGEAHHPVPAILLARLAIDSDFKGMRLGEMLLIEALRDAVKAAEFVGWRVFEVDAPDEEARRFYRRYGFVSVTEESSKLYLTRQAVYQAVAATSSAAQGGL